MLQVCINSSFVSMPLKEMPARVCQTCGEEYVDEDIAARLLQIAEEASQAGVQIDVRRYVAA